MKRCLLLINILIFAPVLLFAQESVPGEEKLPLSIRVNAYPIEFETEFALSRKLTVHSTIGLDYSFGEGIFATNFFDVSDPYLQLSSRYYYNLGKRYSEEKNISGFSGNYVGLYSIFHLEDLYAPENRATRNTFIAGPTWGIQRKISDVAHIDFFGGWGFGWVFEDRFEDRSFAMAPILGLKLGFYLK